jgi:hypothetical protein
MTTKAATGFLADLRAKRPCSDGLAWAVEHEIASIQEAWTRLPRADWMLWLAQAFAAELPDEPLREFGRACADRAIHVHAVAALRAAGLMAEADRLAALPVIVDEPTAWAAAWAAAGAPGQPGQPPGQPPGRLGSLGSRQGSRLGSRAALAG